MKNQCFDRDMSDKFWTPEIVQEMEPKALKILVTYAQRADTLLIKQLAKEVTPELPQFNSALCRDCFQWIQTTLYELECSDDWNYGEIPCITAIVLAAPEQPIYVMAERSRIEAGLNAPLSWEDYKTFHITPVFEFPHWKQVIDALYEE